MGKHGRKRWIRDWRGKLKRSTDRTQKDWQGALGSRRARDRILDRAFSRSRWYNDKRKGDLCPQCKFLNKDRPTRYWSVRYDLGELRVPWHINLRDHPRFRALQAEFGHVYNERLKVPEHPYPTTGRMAQLRAEEIARFGHPLGTNWGPHTFRLWAERREWSHPDLSDRRIVRITEEPYYDVRVCEPCRRKQDVAWKLHYSGAELRRRWRVGRSTKIWRHLEEVSRRAQAKQAVRRALRDPEAYDNIPTKLQKGWLD